jgi:hypothetical protein
MINSARAYLSESWRSVRPELALFRDIAGLDAAALAPFLTAGTGSPEATPPGR